MKVFILCGGLGSRLREFTELVPKPMVEIGGRPILWHIMKHYAVHGFTDFVLCLGYKGSMIREYFLNFRAMTRDFTIDLKADPNIRYHARNDKFEDWRVTLADTGEAAMTGARIRAAARYLGDDDTFAVTYGDGLTDVNLGELLAFHRSHGGVATVLGARPRSRFGELSHKSGKVTAYTEKPEVGPGLVNGGFFLFNRSFLSYLSDDASCVLEESPLSQCAADGELHVFEHHGFWQCMDTFREWQYLQDLWGAGAAPWKTW